MTDPVLTSALSQNEVYFFCALKIEFPSATVRLLDGSGVLVIGGETYSGEDPDFGVVKSLDTVTESDGDEAPELELVLNAPSVTVAATLANPAMQGSPVTIMVGAYDPITGLTVGTPETIFMGEIDVPTLAVSSQDGRTVEYSIISVFERLFEVDEGVRASSGYHQSIWPGELGLDFVTGTERSLYWGLKRPPGSGPTGGGGNSFYGGSFRGGGKISIR